MWEDEVELFPFYETFNSSPADTKLRHRQLSTLTIGFNPRSKLTFVGQQNWFSGFISRFFEEILLPNTSVDEWIYFSQKNNLSSAESIKGFGGDRGGETTVSRWDCVWIHKSHKSAVSQWGT